MVGCILVGTAFAGVGPASKATGGVTLDAPWGETLFTFSAHETTPPRGEAQFRMLTTGQYYHAKVRCVNVIAPDTALFVLEVTSSNEPWVGLWVFIKVYDGGTPGTKGDLAWGGFVDKEVALEHCKAGTTPDDLLTLSSVLRGNLVVNKRQREI